MRRILLTAAICAAAAAGWAADDDIVGERNLLHEIPAINADGTVNVVVECPAGTTAKWQVEPDGVLRRQWQDGAPLDIDYLPFLANYGMIPRTLVPTAIGGEGEQLDIQIIGDVIPRGTVVRVHVIGALALLDKGSQDDKLVAVVEGTPLGAVRDIVELDARYPGISRILETWWVNFKGQEVTASFGYVGAKAARRHINAAAEAFDRNPPDKERHAR